MISNQRTVFIASLAAPLLAAQVSAEVEGESIAELPPLIVEGEETANTRPVATYETPVSNLDFDPRVDLQSRNMAEAQGDISVRGGIFENTGIRVGSSSLMDPQTGHYVAELPIAPEMLEAHEVLTGADNARLGFNSSVGTISYGWSRIEDGGSLSAGFGDHGLNFQRLHSGWTSAVGDSGDWSLGIEGEYSRSESDGTIDFGDHDFARSSGRIQLIGPSSQTDIYAGYQEKFFGWPNMYTPFGTNETENLKTRLFMLNHKQEYGTSSFWEVTGSYRRNSDHYVYSRETPSIYQAVHETDVISAGLSGYHAVDDAFGVNYSAQFTADSIDSTSLENSFTSRSYYKVNVLPEYRIDLAAGETLTVRAGASYDDTNRDDSEVSAIGDITWKRVHEGGVSESIYLSYAEASQVAGYTAIGGSTTGGLFRSNRDLGREVSRNLELGAKLERSDWSLESAVFYRWDDDLTDWTYSYDYTSARIAEPVDIETFGFEVIGSKRWKQVEVVASYAYLHKDEDYGSDDIDASFYALNFPNHRVTLGAVWKPVDWFEARVDNEWRKQEDNVLRSGGDDAFYTNLSLSFHPPQLDGLEIFAAVDNLWDESFQDVPGTPGRGDQYSAGIIYRW